MSLTLSGHCRVYGPKWTRFLPLGTHSLVRVTEKQADKNENMASFKIAQTWKNQNVLH